MTLNPQITKHARSAIRAYVDSQGEGSRHVVTEAIFAEIDKLAANTDLGAKRSGPFRWPIYRAKLTVDGVTRYWDFVYTVDENGELRVLDFKGFINF